MIDSEHSSVLSCVIFCVLFCRTMESSPSGMPRIVVRRNSAPSRKGSADGALSAGTGMRTSTEGAGMGLRRRSSRISRVSDDSAVGLSTHLPTSTGGWNLRQSKSVAEDQVGLQASAVSCVGRATCPGMASLPTKTCRNIWAPIADKLWWSALRSYVYVHPYRCECFSIVYVARSLYMWGVHVRYLDFLGQ